MFEPDDFTDEPPSAAPMGVAQLLRRVKSALSARWSRVCVEGELRSIKTYPSGHVYFDVHDLQEDATLSCVMFRRDAMGLTFSPRMGDRVELVGSLNIYEPRGQLNCVVRRMQPAGLGALYAQFLAIKERLARQGLFDSAIKRPLPPYPNTIGVVTSPQAAALTDVLRTIARHAPWLSVIIYPCTVQGATCEADVLAALDAADARAEVDVLLLVRGGGSLQDLWGFNSERIAYRLRSMSIPVIAGIGHESDVTIADWASDARAATPTAAAVLATEHWARVPEWLDAWQRRATMAMQRRLKQEAQRVPEFARLVRALRAQWRQLTMRLQMAARLREHMQTGLDNRARRLDEASDALLRAQQQLLQAHQNQLDRLEWRLLAAKPQMAAERQKLGQLARALVQAAEIGCAQQRQRLEALAQRMNSLDVQNVLRRGYSLVTDAQGRVLRHAQDAPVGSLVHVRLAQGALQAQVTGLEPQDKTRATNNVS